MDTKRYEIRLRNAELAVFDLDGTLFSLEVDWEGLKEEVFSFCRREGADIEITTLREAYIWSASRPDLKRRIVRIQESYERINLSKARKIPEGIAYLEWRTNMDLKSALFSSNTLPTAERLVGRFELDIIATIENITIPKPSPEGLIGIIDAIGVERGKTVMVGNSQNDKGAAQAAGVPYVDISDVDGGWFR
jgi:pyrophosphatase PpaX